MRERLPAILAVAAVYELTTEGVAENFDVRGGLLTWDTGHPSLELNQEGQATSHGTLFSSGIASHHQRAWQLPSPSVTEASRGFVVRAVLGYSTHTDSMVFWIALRRGAVLGGSIQVDTSAIYAARLA